MIAIIGAMDDEIKEFHKESTLIRKEEWNDFIFYVSEFRGKEVVLAKTGVGKALSAMLTQRLIDEFNPEAVIFTGLAGALNPEYEIGDIVAAKDFIQHDIDATALGFKRGEIPYTKFHILESDKNLLSIASKYKPAEGTLHIGRVLTGDQFITRKNSDVLKYMTDELIGDAAEMEGASTGLVCAVNKIPYLLIRIISDKADGKAHIKFSEFLPVASKKSCNIVEYILEKL